MISLKVRAGVAEVREALLWDKSAVPLLDFPTQLGQHRQAPTSMLSANLATTTCPCPGDPDSHAQPESP